MNEEFKKKILEGILKNARAIIEDGQQHIPIIMCYDKEHRGYILKLEIEDDSKKEMIAEAKKFIKEKKIIFTFTILEGWMKAFAKEENAQAYVDGRKRVRDAEDKKEILNIIYEDRILQETYLCKIEEVEGKRILLDPEKMDSVQTIWSFFPRLHIASDTVN